MANKETSPLGHNMDTEKLFKLIQDQNFESEEEINQFMKENVMGRRIDDVLAEHGNKDDPKYRAQQLIDEAYEASSASKAKLLAKKALELDGDNADAFILLADLEDTIHERLDGLREAVAAGIRSIGEENFEENKGHFWGMVETRPFMRAKATLAETLYLIGHKHESIEHYQEMLELNPVDNQGNRYAVAIYLVELGRWKEYEILWEAYENDMGALWVYTRALYQYKLTGPGIEANRTLRIAYKANPHFLDLLLGVTELPKEMPEYYGIGDENEAIMTMFKSGMVWINTPGSQDWAAEFYDKNRRRKKAKPKGLRRWRK